MGVVGVVQFSDLEGQWLRIEPDETTLRTPPEIPFSRRREETVSKALVERHTLSTAKKAVLNFFDLHTLLK